MSGKSRILVIGGTGYLGKFIVEEAAKAGHPTSILVRESTLSSPDKSEIFENFRGLGVNFVKGDINDQVSLEKAIEAVDVVISAVGSVQVSQQDKIIAAIKKSGNIKRFFPSEFGNDVDRSHAVEPAKSMYDVKAKIRRSVEAENIPYTFVSNNFFMGYLLETLAPGLKAPPRDKVVIFGNGDPKAVFNKEKDIATYTIKAVEDPRTLNKILYVRPPKNVCSLNDVMSLWEKKIGKTVERIYIPDDQVLKNIQEAAFPENLVTAICHSVFVMGDHTNFEIEDSFGVEASELYPDVKYTTVDEFLDQFV